MLSMLFSVFLGKTTDGVPTDPCREVNPCSNTSPASLPDTPTSGSIKPPSSLPDQVTSFLTPLSENGSKLWTDLNKAHDKLPAKNLNNVVTPPSYFDQPELWPILEHPVPRPCLEVNPVDWSISSNPVDWSISSNPVDWSISSNPVDWSISSNPVDWSISSTMTPPSLNRSCVTSTPQQNTQPPRKLEEGVFDLEMDRERAAMDMLGVEEHKDYVTYDPIRWKLWQEHNSQPGSRFCLQPAITPEIRSQFLKWLSSQASRLNCSLEAWCLAVNYLDRFMCVQPMSVADYGLAGVTALFIASREVDPSPASIERLAISPNKSSSFAIYCKPEYISKMEVILLNALQRQLDVPTVTYFLSHLSEGIKIQEWQIHIQRHLVEMALGDRLLSKYPPSQVALAIFDMTKAPISRIIRSVSPLCPKCEPNRSKQDEEDLIERLFEDLATVLIQSQ